MLLALLLAAPANAQNVTNWRLAHYLPADHFFAAEWLPQWTHRLEQASGGRLRIQIIPNNELLRLGAIAPGVRDGKAEMGFGPAPEDAALAVLGLPFMVDSAWHGTKVAMALLEGGELAGAMAGMHVALLQTNAPSLIHSREKPIRTPVDMQGMRMRGATAGIRDLLAALGSTPVEGFLAPQVYGALRDGHVDGTVFPWEAMRVFDLGEQLDYHTEVYLFVATLGLFVNAEALAALPEDLRGIVLAHSGLEVAHAAAAAWDAEEVRGRERAMQLGNRILQPTAAEREAWRDAAEGFTRARLEAIGRGVADPQGLYAQVRRLADEHRAEAPTAGSLEQLIGWIQGDWSNEVQFRSQQTPDGGEPEFSWLTMKRRVIEVPALGHHVVYAQIDRGGTDAVYRRTFLAFEVDADGAINTRVWRWRDAATAAGLEHRLAELHAAPREAFEPALAEGCVMRWRRDGERYVGEVDAKRCAIVSARTGETRHIRATETVAPDSIQAEEAGFTPDGRQLFGGPAGVYYTYARASLAARDPQLAQIPAGRFLMGSSGTETVDQGADARRVNNETPAHDVRFGAAFRMGRNEVTRGEFARFVAATGRKMSGCSNWENNGWVHHPELDWTNPGYEQTDDHPVVCVSWLDARAYIDWLNARTGMKYRLPSEAAWEYAARSGHAAQRDWSGDELACAYSNGADFAAARADGLPQRPGIVFPCDDGHPYTAPVGRFAPNAFGLHDMLGNVWEWTEDCYAPSHSGAPDDGSARKDGDCERHVMRGGSWKYPARTVRFAIRGPGLATDRNNNAGFRLASD